MQWQLSLYIEYATQTLPSDVQEVQNPPGVQMPQSADPTKPEACWIPYRGDGSGQAGPGGQSAQPLLRVTSPLSGHGVPASTALGWSPWSMPCEGRGVVGEGPYILV